MRVVVIGAGMGGLAAALDLARQGVDVTVLERAETPGGKMRNQSPLPGRPIGAGPTVFTMRWVFDSLFADAGAVLEDHVILTRAETLARHAWGTDRLDLFADINRSADAIGAFCGEAAGFRAFAAEARRIYQTLQKPFIEAARPSPLSLTRGAGVAAMFGIRPFDTMASALAKHFRDPRLRQLFGRYATYCGSSPYRAPATLMLVAHVEQEGVWLVEGGLHQVAVATARVFKGQGGTIRYGAEVATILRRNGHACGVRLASGEVLDADAIICNADPAAMVTAELPASERSFSAVTWAMVAKADGFPLLHHTVFFSPDYAAEFAQLARHVPNPATVYICAQDRPDSEAPEPAGPERLLILINAPAHGDTEMETAPWLDQTTQFLTQSGLTLTPQASLQTAPPDFHRLFPATRGALYGPAVHGAMASFRRPGARTALPGLYLAGGATHPGAGVPMAALSGRQAAAALMADHASILKSRRTATRGGMSTR